MTGRGDLDIVKAGLINRIQELCARLLPDGRQEGPLWVSWNPVENDKGKTPALKVRLRNGDIGAWKCWRCGEKGDVLKLVAYIQRTDTKGALAWSRDFLGLRSMTREEREAMRQVERRRQAERETRDAERRRKKLVAASRLFKNATSPVGQFSAAERHARAYFAARGVPLEEVPCLNPETLRFAAATEWWRGANWSSDGGRRFRTEPGPSFPAVHSAMRQWNGVISCCHVTFLDPLRPAKAPVQPPKLMFGEALGAVIELGMGPTDEPFWTATEPTPLIICEGIETALSFAVNVPEARVWAAGSLAGVGSAPVGLPCVDWILFARDNNQGNTQAQKQFDQALAGLEQHGKRVVVEASHVGDDFNDLAQGQE